MPDEPDLNAVEVWLRDLQERLVATFEAADGKLFRRDAWSREEGGGGLTCVIEDGALFERGGVNFSRVKGSGLPASATASRPQLAGRSYEAMGVSLVLHADNPHVPTVHLNLRFFVAQAANEAPVWWFGGGADLTPVYGYQEDAIHFHQQCRNALDPFGAELYPRFKAACDKYFYLPHRKETRGVGGIFFDDHHEGGFDRAFALAQSVGAHFPPAYLPIVEKRRSQLFGPREREFQRYRRGRYVEFNLVWDRGTLFGLQTGGRTESILMSLPRQAHWRYDWQAEPGTPEARLASEFLISRDWLE